MSNSKQYNITVVGATGMVGREFLGILMQRKFPVGELRLLATARSAGRKIMVGEREIEVEETTEDEDDAPQAAVDALFEH